LEVESPELGNGRVGWIRASQVSMSASRFALRADISKRTLQVRFGGHVVRAFPIAVGRAATPTPRGRFFVTDKLPGPRYGAVFGCCILAISAIQPKSVTGWRTDGRVAIHGLISDRQLGTGVARNVAPTFVAIVTRFGRRNSCGEVGKIDAAVAASVVQELGELIRGKL